MVDLLWRRNSKRIASGSPDMLSVGDRLLLP